MGEIADYYVDRQLTDKPKQVEELVWVDKSGKSTPIGELSAEHKKNIIKMLNKKKEKINIYLKALEK